MKFFALKVVLTFVKFLFPKDINGLKDKNGLAGNARKTELLDLVSYSERIINILTAGT